MTQVEYMKVHGKQIREMVEDLNYSQMGINIKVNMRMAKLMEKEHTHGEIMKYMMENGKVDKKMDTEFGREYKAIVILDNGKVAKLKATEFIHGLMEIDTKENGRNAWDMDKVQISFQMETFISANMKMENRKVTANINGKMEIHTLVISNTEWNMEKADGRRNQVILWMKIMNQWIKMFIINMTVIMNLIKSMDMENSNGNLEINILEIIIKMRGRGME